MPPSPFPIIDPSNPMYCPEVPAARYLQQLRQMRRSSGHLDPYSHRISMGSEQQSSQPSPEDSNPNDTFNNLSLVPPSSAVPFSGDSTQSLKRKREDVESDNDEVLCHATKRIHSDLSQMSSFIMSPDPNQSHLPTLLLAAPLQDSSDSYYNELFKRVNGKVSRPPRHCSPRHVSKLEYELYGRAIGAETAEDVACLLQELDRELPGISLTSQLANLNSVSHQDIVDLLGGNGHLGRHILEYFRGSLVQRLDLSASLSNEEGLNVLKPQIVLDIFALPNSFTRLRELNLNCVSLDDFDLTRLHHLSSLDTLWLNDTGIGNEAIGHLTSLKHQLKELHIEDNDRIDDDCIPSLCLFSSLVLLRTFGTNIKMPGLRRLATTVTEAGRHIDIGIPADCDTYLNNLNTAYELHPRAPLITNPRLCTSLSAGALRANLTAHAIRNPSIFTTGPRVELVDRLKKVLETRLADHVVKEVVWGYELSADFGSEGDSSTLHTEEE